MSARTNPAQQAFPFDDDTEQHITTPRDCRAGESWTLGRHLLICGDSTKMDVPDAADVVIYDPPYDAAWAWQHIPAPRPRLALIVMWDLRRFAVAPSSALNAGWEPRFELVWDCQQSWYVPGRPLARHKSAGLFGSFQFDTQSALIRDGVDRGAERTVGNSRGRYRYQPLDGTKRLASVEGFSNTALARRTSHAHGKPPSWIAAMLAGMGARVVFDMFGGGGSALIACEMIGARCVSVEIDPERCASIAAAWERATGQNAVFSREGG